MNWASALIAYAFAPDTLTDISPDITVGSTATALIVFEGLLRRIAALEAFIGEARAHRRDPARRAVAVVARNAAVAAARWYNQRLQTAWPIGGPDMEMTAEEAHMHGEVENNTSLLSTLLWHIAPELPENITVDIGVIFPPMPYVLMEGAIGRAEHISDYIDGLRAQTDRNLDYYCALSDAIDAHTEMRMFAGFYARKMGLAEPTLRVHALTDTEDRAFAALDVPSVFFDTDD